MSCQGRFVPMSSGHLYLGCFGELVGRDVWLYLPPFAEEMNLSRAIVSRQARAFAERGESVVCLDFYGTGDSEGEFEQASVDLWLNDIRDTIQWIQAQGARNVNLWGLRFGGLLAIHYLVNHPDSGIIRLLLWRPIHDGKLLMGQFFRLKQVSESMKGCDKINWMSKVRQGEIIEVAGYPVTPALLDSITALKITPDHLANLPETVWLEAATARISPVIEKLTRYWPDQRLTLQTAAAPTFWQNPDCYHAPELIKKTLALSGTQGVANVC